MAVNGNLSSTRPILELTVSDRCDAIYLLQETLSLGDTLVSVVQVLEKFYHAIGPVSVKINTTTAIDLTIPGQNIILSFDYNTQRLHKITLQQVQKSVLKYRSAQFSSPAQALLPRLQEIDASFGATRPGQITKDGLYVLTYPGINFTFPLPNNSSKIHNNLVCGEIQIFLNNSTTKNTSDTLPLSTKSNYALESLVICQTHDGEEQKTTKPPPTIIITPESSDETVSKKYGYRFEFTLLHQNKLTHQRQTITRSVRLNDCCQNVQSELGSPDNVFFKSDKQKQFGAPDTIATDFFFNYFKLGVDFLFDGRTKRLKKAMLHTCHPEHQDFGKKYSPCIFSLSRPDNKNSINFSSTLTDLMKSIKSLADPIMVSRNNSCQTMLDELSSITGSNKSSSFVYHSRLYSELYELTANGRLAMLTLY